MSHVTLELKDEIYRAIKKLGGQSDILSIIGSLGDTMSDEDVLLELKAWNDSPDSDGWFTWMGLQCR